MEIQPSSKHAFIITAYTDFDFLLDILKIYKQNQNVDCYIHVDRKSKIPEEFKNWCKQNRVDYFSKYRIKWGSYKHIQAVLYLIKKAVEKDEYSYFHIISGNSFITRNIDDILNFFDEKEQNMNYVQIDDLSVSDPDKTIDPWFRYYHFLHIYNRRSEFGRIFDFYFMRLQMKLGIYRKKSYRYKGLLYAHYTNEFMMYVLDYVKKNPGYLRNLKTCFIGEEFFFQNIIMNSPYKNKIVNNHLLYDKWNSGGVAQFLEEDDYEKIISSDCLFARKFGKESQGLFNKLCNCMVQNK